MLGFMLNKKEMLEMEYMLKRELEEILLDLSDPRIDTMIKRTLEEKYQIVYGIYKRFGSPLEKVKYNLEQQRK